MGWGCYKHEMDACSPEWNRATLALCDRKLEENPRTFGRDGEVCPKCYEEDIVRARSEGREEGIAEAIRVVSGRTRYGLEGLLVLSDPNGPLIDRVGILAALAPSAGTPLAGKQED